MSRGAKIIILTVAGLIAIGLIFFFLILPLFPKASPQETASDANVNAGLPAANANANVNAKPAANAPLPAEVAPEVKLASSARSVARTFAERIDTYTNRNGLANLDDLESISTSAVWKYIDGEYRKGLLKAMPAGNAYYSVVSTAMNVNVAAESANEMNAKVGLQRVESGAVSKTTYPTLDMKLKKSGEEWVVSWLEWEK